MKLTTTLNRLRRAGACDRGMETLIASLPAGFQKKAPIDALDILKSNGVADVEWLLNSSACIENPAPAWAEYHRVKAPALAEYRRVAAPAWAECQRVTAAAWAEYERVAAPAWARILQ